jgi:hypothetical protein
MYAVNLKLIIMKIFQLTIFASLAYLPVYAINNLIDFEQDIIKAKYIEDYKYRLTVYMRSRFIVMPHILIYSILSIFYIIGIDKILLFLLIGIYISSLFHSILREYLRPFTSFIALRLLKHSFYIYFLQKTLLVSTYRIFLILLVTSLIIVSLPSILYYSLFIWKGASIIRSKRKKLSIVILCSVASFLLLFHIYVMYFAYSFDLFEILFKLILIYFIVHVTTSGIVYMLTYKASYIILSYSTKNIKSSFIIYVLRLIVITCFLVFTLIILILIEWRFIES